MPLHRGRASKGAEFRVLGQPAADKVMRTIKSCAEPWADQTPVLYHTTFMPTLPLQLEKSPLERPKL